MSPLFHLLAVFFPWVLEKREEEEVRAIPALMEGARERKRKNERGHKRRKRRGDW